MTDEVQETDTGGSQPSCIFFLSLGVYTCANAEGWIHSRVIKHVRHTDFKKLLDTSILELRGTIF